MWDRYVKFINSFRLLLIIFFCFLLQTDAFWNNKKNEAWSEITRLYNIQQTSGVRTDTQLKYLYDALKRDARRESSNDEVN